MTPAVADMQLIEGKEVRIWEIKPVPYRDERPIEIPRRLFRVVVNKDWRLIQIGGLLPKGVHLCTQHHDGQPCECVTALIRSTLMENESPFGANGRG